ncbi:MAG: hypothetical protein B6U97_04205 [Candidatus Altiarchaeales archaeon ex4484_96]|nr:MAG: hypothetical protein B6U97_04205 [Candidatus Altiarchaeales archaeon ex4484_96]
MQPDKKTTTLIISLLLIELFLLEKTGWLQPITGLMLIYLIPGLSLTLMLYKNNKLTIPEYAASTILLSISLNVLTILSSNLLLKIPITHAKITTQMLSLTALFILGYLLIPKTKKTNHTLKPQLNKPQIIILMASLLFISYNTYLLHADYPFPYHSDEWQDLAQATAIMENKNIIMRNPYLKQETHRFEMEVGFNLFLAEFYILTGWDPVLFYQYLPALTSLITGLILFVLVYNLFKDYYIAILSLLFFSGLKGTIYILGTWFMVAMSLAIPFIYYILYVVDDAVKKNRLTCYLLASISTLTLIVIHPGMGSFIYLSVLSYLAALAVYKIIKKGKDIDLRVIGYNALGILSFALIPLASLTYFIPRLTQDSIVQTIDYFFTEFIVFGRLLKYNGIYEPAFIIDFYGLPAFGLALLGFFYCIRKKKGQIVFIGLSLSLANLLLYQVMGINLLLFYERTVYLVLLYLVIYSGAGLYLMLKMIHGLLQRITKNTWLSKAAVGLMFLAVFYIVFLGQGFNRARMDKQITLDDYMAIKWLSTQAKHKVVMVHPRIADAIYPISLNYVVSPMSHSPEGPDERIKDINRFYLGNCSVKKPILECYDVDYVYFRFGIGCDYLVGVYNSTANIYEVML